MMNLFTMFDPSSFYMSSAWLLMMLPISMIMGKTFLMKNKMNISLKTPKHIMGKEVKELMLKNNKKYSPSKMTNIFMMLMIMNLAALIPFNFTLTAHASLSLVVATSLWVSVVLHGWVSSLKNMMIHMTPLGTPPQLMNFMVLIELVSNLIRPITLSVRLSANMVAGHLLMELLSNFSVMSKMNFLTSSIPMMTLTSLELAVAIIQAYVMTTLITLYHNESF